MLGYPDRSNLGVFCSWSFNSQRSLGLPSPALRRCYIESKVCIVDDEWVTLGTANTDGISLNSYYASGEGRLPFVGSARSIEINATIFDGVAGQPITGMVRQFRSDLWAEHLGTDLKQLASPPSNGWLSVWTGVATANIDGLNSDIPNMRGTVLPYTGYYHDSASKQLIAIGVNPDVFQTTFD
jgi:hypothetical protein